MRKTFDECNPCAFHYDAIIKMETFSEDVTSILEAVGAGWIAPAHANNRDGVNTDYRDSIYLMTVNLGIPGEVPY